MKTVDEVLTRILKNVILGGSALHLDDEFHICPICGDEFCEFRCDHVNGDTFIENYSDHG